jgi:hypothetical protein
MPDHFQPTEELLWRQYNAFIGLFKFYISSLIKLNTFYYAITGAILSFYLTHTEARPLRLALLLPCVLSIALAVIFAWGGLRAKDLTQAMADLNQKLSAVSASASYRPASESLTGLLIIFVILHVLTVLGLIALLLDMVPLSSTIVGKG